MNEAFLHPARLAAQAAAVGPASSAEVWQTTRGKTQIVSRVSDSAPQAGEIGSRVGEHLRELFVACDPAEALSQQFDHLQPEFVALHDLGTHQSRKLLAGIAAAWRSPVQKLVIRRHGSGAELAAVEFLDLSARSGAKIRIYCTQADTDGDAAAQQALARILLGRSRLGIALVAELPGEGLAAALAPLREAALQGGWRCGRLLFMPLGPGRELPAEIAKFRSATQIEASATSRVTRPAEVWSQLCAAWNELQRRRPDAADSATMPLMMTAGNSSATAATATAATAASAVPTPALLAVAPVAALPPGPATAVPASAPQAPAAAAPRTEAAPEGDRALRRYLGDMVLLDGVMGACVFEIASGRVLGFAGNHPNGETLAQQGAALIAAVASASLAMNLGEAVPDANLTLARHHLLLRPMPTHAGCALHVVLDRAMTPLALALARMRRLDEALLAAQRPTAA